MKQKIGILLLMLTFAVTLSTECKQDTVLHSPQITLEQVEAFKVDDSEFKSAVATKSSFGSEKNEAGAGLIGFLISLTMLVQRRKQAIGLAALFIVGSILSFHFENATPDLSLAVLPLIPFMRSLDVETISGEEVKKLLAEMGKEHKKEMGDVTKQIAEAVKGLMTTDVLKAELEKAGLKAEEIKTLSDAVVEQGKVLAEIKEKANRVNESKDIQQVVDEQGVALKALADKGDKNDQVKFKVNKTIISRSG